RSGKSPHDIGVFYLNQLTKEGREEMQDSRSGSFTLRWQREVKNNHSWDCEVYSVGAALMAGLISGSKECRI
ncbi:MAG: hypothetical protein QOJ51_2822, partial [Acidobacteriaceae bacterium]|nr:hypothetical protein [Acidobacteriaceae bacterium]